jgi:RNA polymerase sigma factor (TIGR02999 family)
LEAELTSIKEQVMRGLISYHEQLKRWVNSLTYPVGVPIIAAQSARSALTPMSSASHSRKEITGMLRAWSDGEQQASDDLIRAVYDQLKLQARRQLRRERRNHTLDTGSLINEAYLKLIEQRSVSWRDRGHFFALAAELMRRVLVDHARARNMQKRGGATELLALDDIAVIVQAVSTPIDVDLIALDEALDRLAVIDEQQVRVVELRYFADLGITETAEVLNISPATVKRDWAAAKAWLKHEMTREARS